MVTIVVGALKLMILVITLYIGETHEIETTRIDFNFCIEYCAGATS